MQWEQWWVGAEGQAQTSWTFWLYNMLPRTKPRAPGPGPIRKSEWNTHRHSLTSRSACHPSHRQCPRIRPQDSWSLSLPLNLNPNFKPKAYHAKVDPGQASSHYVLACPQVVGCQNHGRSSSPPFNMPPPIFRVPTNRPYSGTVYEVRSHEFRLRFRV